MARALPADNPQDFVARGQEQQSGAPLARNLVVDQDFLELLAPNRKFDEIARLPVTEHERLSLEDVRVQVEPAGAVRCGQRIEELCLDDGVAIVGAPRDNDRDG